MGKPYPEPEFQSTLPSQGATQWFCTMSLTLVFQSTLPSQGATRTTLTIQALIMVFQSTLPSQGATFPHLVNLFANVDFNPRSPHRERLVPLTMAGAAYQFQSTLPSQGATKHVSDFNAELQFQSTLPSQGATNVPNGAELIKKISIHAPLTGSDTTTFRSVPLYS